MNSSANQFEANHNLDTALPSEAATDAGQNTEELLPAVKPSSRGWKWLLMGLLISCTLGSIATLAFLWLTSLPPRTNCDEISALSPDIDRLSCAQEAARSGEVTDLMQGLELVESWPPEHPLHNEAQRWMEEWSKSVLIIARQKMSDSDLKGAIELANRIPKSSPLYADAQATIKKWQGKWQVDQAIYAKAQDALKQQNWEGVSQRILELSESPYRYWNSEKVNELSQRVLKEKKARQTLAQAKRLAQFSTPENIKAAIDLAKQMDAKSYTWSEAQPTLTQWGNTLLTIGFQRWQERRLDEAIGFAQTVATVPALTQESQNLLKLSQARQLAISSDTRWKPTPKHVWSLMEATDAARQIPSDSRFYAQAQDSLKSWEAQLQDTTQLQYAQVMADLGQRDLVQAAIAQAKDITPDHPRRLQAQTLIAHWQNEVERIEDRPYLLYARQLAEQGTIPAYKAAIAEASKVKMGRTLRGEAQGLIYEWGWQIQALEDSPFLTMARLQADQGNLTEAIRSAAKIPAGRALYYEAQAAIADWQAELNRVAIARNRREESRNSVSTSEVESKQPEPIEEIQSLPLIEPAVTLPSPAEAAPSPVPAPPPTQRARRQSPVAAPETPSPFVLEENTPLFEEPAPAADRNYDMDDVPRLINRGSQHHTPAPTVESRPPATAPAPVEATTPEDANPFRTEGLSPLFEESDPPLTESAPPASDPVSQGEEVPPANESSSAIETNPAATESSVQSMVSPTAVPLSMDVPKTEGVLPVEATSEPASLVPSSKIPLPMNDPDPTIGG